MEVRCSQAIKERLPGEPGRVFCTHLLKTIFYNQAIDNISSYNKMFSKFKFALIAFCRAAKLIFPSILI